MSLSAVSLGRSARKIVARIRKVRRAAEKASNSKKRFAQYRYLRSAYSAYRYFEDEGLLSHLMEVAPSTLMTPVRSHSSPVRVILDATCRRTDVKKRSRWTRALEFAVAERTDPDELERFLQAHNGIAGCADLASKTKPKLSSRHRELGKN